MPTSKLPQFKKIHGLALVLPLAFLSVLTPIKLQTAVAQTAAQGRPLQIRSDVQEYDAKTRVVTARGNVQMVYSARGIQATAAQAQYFSNEQQIVLSGNVYILQQGVNSIRGERVTYLIDQGRFIAQPQSGRQVESIYLVNDAPNNPASTQAPKTPALKRGN
ncbi:LptA/OstA family protein [Calothrix sp. PCC 6303]|uniref:LptA/OstA family protein n=1 Tax=Calothrix sp. PCC 6303 TaxID=1170562 RepID=UPI0002A042F7|nr:LptA/OstA family protein [Calothrix sp. PCC 6303]AFZ03438.1 OstA family protein [Calothrix sp. PCC 6303]